MEEKGEDRQVSGWAHLRTAGAFVEWKLQSPGVLKGQRGSHGRGCMCRDSILRTAGLRAGFTKGDLCSETHAGGVWIGGKGKTRGWGPGKR